MFAWLFLTCCIHSQVQIPLHPLLKQGLLDPSDIIIDAKSGVSGAGRDPKEGTLYCEVRQEFLASVYLLLFEVQ